MLSEERRLLLPASGPRYSHYVFRYPAKFHPPVVQALMERFVPAGGTLFDNFCGSGTSLLEAAVSGRRSVGLDIDPVAVLVSTAKTRRYDSAELQRDAEVVLAALAPLERPPVEYDRRTFDDLTDAEFERDVAADDLWVPAIPRLSHWFRRYVTVDLARMKRVLLNADVAEPNRILFLLAFAGMIRNVSNADPVPVSGLEVTAHMLKKEAEGRRINPIDQYRGVLKKAILAVTAYSDQVQPGDEPVVMPGDATALPTSVPAGLDALLTSPPYHNAVDYYRRHQLEMYWLRLVEDHQERLSLLPQYIGRQRIPQKHDLLQGEWQPGPLALEWYERIAAVDRTRATDFRHYIASMQRVFEQLPKVMRTDAPLMFVVGESAWREEIIPTGTLLAEAASPHYGLEERLWYPIKNRYMSYTRRNGADIAQEHVLVFR